MSEKFLPLLHEWSDMAMRHSMGAFFRFIQAHGYSTSQINTIMYIHQAPDASNNSLAKQLGVTKPAVSQLVDRLVEQGVIERREDPNDRRSNRLVLTPLGKALVAEAKYARHAWLEEFESQFSQEQQSEAEPVLALIVQKLREYNLEKDQTTISKA